MCHTAISTYHRSSWDGDPSEAACRGLDHANLKQKRNLRLLSRLTVGGGLLFSYLWLVRSTLRTPVVRRVTTNTTRAVVGGRPV